MEKTDQRRASLFVPRKITNQVIKSKNMNCRRYGGEENCMQGSAGEYRRKETTSKK